MSGREPAMPRPPGSGMPQAKDLVLLVVFLILGILRVLVLLVVLLLVRGRRVLVAVLLAHNGITSFFGFFDDSLHPLCGKYTRGSCEKLQNLIESICAARRFSGLF